MSPAALYSLPQEIDSYAASQQRRFMLFFPVAETDNTTSTLFPQKLHVRTALLASALAATLVFDFTFPAMIIPPFHFLCL